MSRSIWILVPLLLAMSPVFADEQKISPIELCGAKGDGITDDGPALQICANRFDTLKFRRASYRIATPVIISNHPVLFEGSGWAEQLDEGGTYFILDNPRISPFTVSGIHARGTTFRDLAVHQAQPPPIANWKPKIYPPVFVLRGVAGATYFRNILCAGVYSCISSFASGRLNVDGLYGQVFQSLISVAYSYDSDRISNVHVWPYWSSDVNIMTFQQNNADALVLGREDSPFIGSIFGIGLRSIIHVIDSPSGGASLPAGTATKVSIDRLDSDGSKYAVWVSGSNVTMQIASMTHQSELWAGTAAVKSPPPPIPGSAMLYIDGPGAVIQIGSATSEITDQHVVWLENMSTGSQVEIQSVFAREYGGTPFQADNIPAGKPHFLRIGMMPMLYPLASNRAPIINDHTNAGFASGP